LSCYNSQVNRTDPMPATIPTPTLRLALVSWRGEILQLSTKYPELYPDIWDRLDVLDSALLAIDTSTSVELVPVA
jgi:hypothetical protein